MKTCTHCKTENIDSANFCRQCGFLFPGFKIKGENQDVSLIDTVNELQKRVNDSERAGNTLNSQVASLNSELTSLRNQLGESQRQLSSANRELNIEKQKNADAQKKTDEAIKEKEDAVSSKDSLHVLYIFAIIIVVIIAIVQCTGKDDAIAGRDYWIDEASSLSSQMEELKGKVNELKSKNKSMSSVLAKIGSKTPLFIEDVYVRNQGDSYGTTIYGSTNTYINPKLKIFSLIGGGVDIDVKLFTPYGFSQGENIRIGYSQTQWFYMNKNETNTCEFYGYGCGEGRHWPSGAYRYEFYYKGKCIGSKSFRIY